MVSIAYTKIFPVWGLVVEIFTQKAKFKMGWVLSTPSCQYQCNKMNILTL